MREEGYYAEVVERHIPYSHIKQDFLGFADILAIQRGRPGVVAIQTTSSSNQSARLKKILASKLAPIWLEVGNLIEIHGWGKKGKVGKRKLWTVNRFVVTKSDFESPDDAVSALQEHLVDMDDE